MKDTCPGPKTADESDTLLLLTDDMQEIADEVIARLHAAAGAIDPTVEVRAAQAVADGSEIQLKRLHCGSQIFDTPSKLSEAAASPNAKDPSKGACHKDGHIASCTTWELIS